MHANSMKITYSQLAQYVIDQLESGTSTAVVAQHVAAYLTDTRQTRDISKVARALEAEMNRRGTTQVTVTSAHAMSSEVMQELARMLDAQNPIFFEEIDSRVIGGVKAEAGERVIDLTVRRKLDKFKAIVGN